MCTKKWTLSKVKQFHKRRLEIIKSRNNKKKRGGDSGRRR